MEQAGFRKVYTVDTYRRPHSYLVAAFGLCGLRKSLRLHRNLGYSGVFAAVLSRYVPKPLCGGAEKSLLGGNDVQVQNQQTRPIQLFRGVRQVDVVSRNSWQWRILLSKALSWDGMSNQCQWRVGTSRISALSMT